MGAITALRDRQQSDAEEVRRRAVEVVERKKVLDELLVRLRGVAEAVKEVAGLLEAAKEGERPVDDALARIGALVDEAQSFAADAKASDFHGITASKGSGSAR